MSSTPEGPLVLRDDRPVPEGFDGETPAGATVLVALPGAPADADPVGVVVLSGRAPVLSLERLWLRPGPRSTTDLAATVVELARARARGLGATVLGVEVRHGDPTMTALAAGTRVLGEYLTRDVRVAPALPVGLGWRAMTAVEYAPWYDAQVRAYAEDGRARSGGDLEHALERSRADFARVLPAGLGTPDTSLVVLVVGGERVGHLWLAHHRPGAETFGFDLEIVPEHRRQGWGRAAIALASRLAGEAGDQVLGLHVFGQNARARALYASEGFVVRSTTHDLLAPA